MLCSKAVVKNKLIENNRATIILVTLISMEPNVPKFRANTLVVKKETRGKRITKLNRVFIIYLLISE